MRVSRQRDDHFIGVILLDDSREVGHRTEAREAANVATALVAHEADQPVIEARLRRQHMHHRQTQRFTADDDHTAHALALTVQPCPSE